MYKTSNGEIVGFTLCEYFANRVLIRWEPESGKFGWMPAEYKMSQWRPTAGGYSELWHLVTQGSLVGQFWVSDKDMRCPHTEMKKWLRIT